MVKRRDPVASCKSHVFTLDVEKKGKKTVFWGAKPAINFEEPF